MSRATVTVFCATNVGLLRDGNEDAFVVSDVASGLAIAQAEARTLALPKAGILLMVCDGMGGAAAGEVASHLATKNVVRGLFQHRDVVSEAPTVDALVWALRLANRAIFDESRRCEDKRGMGTTCTAGVVLADRLILAQVGDSRAYLLRDDALQRLTSDQSLAAAMIESGALCPKDVDDFDVSHVILQALGVKEDVDPVASEIILAPGDLVLLCTDGLHGPVPDERIAAILTRAPSLDVCAEALIQAALEAGGPDNVTVVLAKHERAG